MDRGLERAAAQSRQSNRAAGREPPAPGDPDGRHAQHARPSDEDIALLDEHLRLIAGRADTVVGYFYAALFVEDPALRSLFPAAMDVQRERLFRALTGAVRHIGNAETFVPMLRQLGRDHRKYGVRTEHYDTFGRALLTALATYGEDIWVPELEDAWLRAYHYMATTMIEGAQQAAVNQPAWWRGEIIAHERRAEDIAVLTVRTDHPYTYRAGQFASVETTFRPRTWRTYSMATGQSPDGLLEFHVRAVGAGFVSGPLVWRATVGDVLKVGAPMGELAIDKQSQRDVLCIGGGTGLAPIKALVDEMTRWNTARKVAIFFGARRSGDLYDMSSLHRMAAINPWLTVIPCVSEDDSFAGERGNLPDVVARHGRWSEHDVVVSGSPAMTRATLSRLRDLGVPDQRVSTDMAGSVHPAAAHVIDLRRSRANRATSRRR
jgi:NAD(P)H-flavin reductase/hemoglobin-like flavoprotein